MKNNIPRIMIVGTGSGCGKTTITCALLQALKDREKSITAFKCGPDYIDPMFHSKILETRSRNLDMFMCGENTVKYLMATDSKESEMAVIEGVMGIYDGLSFDDDRCSANRTALATNTPELLVVNVKGKAISLAAEVKGYLEFSRNNIKGLILNNCSKAMYTIYKEMLEKQLNIPCFGYMPVVKDAELGSRHLGLITADEIVDLKHKMSVLGFAAENSLDIDGMIQLASDTEPFTFDDIALPESPDEKVKIAIAQDNAFCFYYEDSLELLRNLGVELIPFSPISDKKLPGNVKGLIIGGGYPELYLDKLSANIDMLKSIRDAVNGGMPTFAECGGFMYLGETITFEGIRYNMVSAIPGNSSMTDHLVRFGYKTIKAKHNNVMCKCGDETRCHEFHYSETDDYGADFEESNLRGTKWESIQANDHLFAGYPHLHLWSNISFAVSFVDNCRNY